MVPFLKYMGIKSLDAVVITHGDKDHISGIQEILQDRKHMNLTIERLILPDVEKKDKTYVELLRSAQEQNIACSFWGKGIQWNIKDFSIKVLHPFYDYQWESENDYSMILLTEYQGFRCLFTGDMETGAEACVSGKVGKIDYLKVAHHGSKYTSGETFLKELSPKEAVISYGIKNRKSVTADLVYGKTGCDHDGSEKWKLSYKRIQNTRVISGRGSDFMV